jgi:hypothetical protein
LRPATTRPATTLPARPASPPTGDRKEPADLHDVVTFDAEHGQVRETHPRANTLREYAKPRARHCSVCGKADHDARTCPEA